MRSLVPGVVMVMGGLLLNKVREEAKANIRTEAAEPLSETSPAVKWIDQRATYM